MSESQEEPNLFDDMAKVEFPSAGDKLFTSQKGGGPTLTSTGTTTAGTRTPKDTKMQPTF